jgi:DNA modification methylase
MNFSKPLPQDILNIEEKSRSNLFAWRGQFSPQLVECLLSAYCPDGAVILDPFAGSGTVLLEAARLNLSAFGFEINPSAWTFAKLYEFANIQPDARAHIISELRAVIDAEFPLVLFQDEDFPEAELEERIIRISDALSDNAKILCNALVVLLDIFKNKVNCALVQSKFSALAELVLNLPFSAAPLKADLHDARSLPLGNQSIDFIITSPPYINVFNYHQNYRRSVEVLGWDPLQVARSEIGSNRANRGNRFLTVIQYCIDIAGALQESARVLKSGGHAVFILGYESNVLGVPFYNADIVERIAEDSGLFEIVQRQQRHFTNRFGKSIREDILNMTRLSYSNGKDLAERIGRFIARQALQAGDDVVDDKNKKLLREAISRVPGTDGTSIFDSRTYSNYHTRKNVMMVKEERNEYRMSQEKTGLPTPHFAKLKALLQNQRLPSEDKERLEEVFCLSWNRSEKPVS